MKDYRLSEIKNGYWGDSDITKSRGEYELLCELQYDLEDENIEPRDMLELPCKIPLTAINGQVLSWQVVYRSVLGTGDIRTRLFGSEAEADAFLAELKGDKE